MSDAAASAQPSPATTTEEAKISPAEAKKRAKAEKQARRAAQKEQQGGVGNAISVPADGSAQESSSRRPAGGPVQDVKQKSQSQQAKGQQQKPQRQGGTDQRAQDRNTSQQGLAVRRRPSQSGSARENIKKENKQVELFSHLYAQPRRHALEGASKDVHPAVLALGQQIANYEVSGSSARCVAMLLAFKEVVQAYTTPAGTSLPRHLTSHYLSPQIEFLKSCRPISESMGNAIRYLKKIIVEIDPNTAEHEAKEYLCDEIDRFIRERIVVTDQAIAALAEKQIKPGSVVLTYAKSAIVQKTILQAHERGTKFRVVVVDSRPLFEGKQLATSLMRAGVEVEYVPFSGIAYATKAATLVLLGAHSMLSNGRLQSRVGTASVAMQAHKGDIPVIVLCESVKFSGKVALDSIVQNEVAPPEELFLTSHSPAYAGPAKPATDKKGDAVSDEPQKLSLADWREIPNLQILNIMYDVTPAQYIRMVICEYGSVPPSSVPVVHRLANEGE